MITARRMFQRQTAAVLLPGAVALGDLDVAGDLGVDGDSVMLGQLDVTGDAVFREDAAITGALDVTANVIAAKFRASGGTIGSPSYGWTADDTLGRYKSGSAQLDVLAGAIYWQVSNLSIGSEGAGGGAPLRNGWGWALTNDQAFALTASQNNYAPGNPGAQPIWRITPDAPWSVTGIVAPTVYGTDGVLVLVQNAATVAGRNVTLTDQDAASTAANRIITPNAANVVIPPGGGALIAYDSTAARWRAYPLF